MKNIKYILVALALMISCASCQDDDNSGELFIRSDDSRVNMGADGTTAEVAAGHEGGTVIFTVYSNTSWKAYSDVGDWCVTEQANGTLAVLVDNLPSTLESREATVSLINAEGGNARIRITQSPGEGTYLELTGKTHTVPSRGGTIEVTVHSNSDLIEVELDTGELPWLTADYDHSSGVISLSGRRNITGSPLHAVLRVTAGTGNEKVAAQWDLVQQTGSMILEYTIPEGSTPVAVPVWGEVDCEIDWGDGTAPEVVKKIIGKDQAGSEYVRHWYEKPGIYHVSITGSAEGFACGSIPRVTDNLSNLVQWGSLALKNLDDAFMGSSLKTVPLPEGDEAMAGIKSAVGIFAYCESLEKLPRGIFDNMPGIISFQGAFYGCKALREIDAGIFDNCTMVQDFSYAFHGCKSLEGESPFTTVEGQRVHLYERENYPDSFAAPFGEGAFTGCESLEDYNSIPSGWL